MKSKFMEVAHQEIKKTINENETQRSQGRPTIYSEELVNRMCELIENNPVSIQQLRENNDWFPGETAIHRWKTEHEGFRKRYIRAKKAQARLHIEQSIKIPDTLNLEEYDPKIANAVVAKAKLQCEVRQWYAARLLPKEFSATTQVDSKIKATVKTEKAEVDLSLFTEEELKIWKALQQKAQVKKVTDEASNNKTD
jgi:hypothetical protein